MYYLKCLTVVFALTFIPFLTQAQNSSIDATAHVFEAISVFGVNNLDFGNVVAGTTKQVLPGDAEAGRFDISGETQAEVSLSFTLPSVLENNIDPSETLDITFSNDDAIFNTDNDASSGTSIDPNSSSIANLSVGGELNVFIGGTLTSGSNQVPGEYEGTITLTVDYTGN